MIKREIGALYEYNGRYLCPMEKSYLQDLKKWRNAQINVLRQFKPLTDCDQEAWFESLHHDTTQVLYAILVPDKNSNNSYFIGYCGVTNIDFRNKRGEISFLVNPDRASDEKLYREDFLAVLEMLSSYSFQELNLNKLFTETFAFREVHMKILEAFGFKREGVLRSHQFTKGQYVDSVVHSLLAVEWIERKNKT